MCGIVGAVGNIGVTRKQISKFVADLSLRGPDFSSIHENPGNFILGFTRLALMDFASSANQPYELDNCILLFNGEI